MQILPRPTPRLPKNWNKFVDEQLPDFVKSHFSPRDSWKGKPFNKMDAEFYFGSIDELSQLFTEDRGSSVGNYFRQPKYRSAYFLYFVPLQLIKFYLLFDSLADLLRNAFKKTSELGLPLRILDLGAGPGTASLALKIWCDAEKIATPIEWHWVDTDETILKDGQAFFKKLYPDSNITLHTEQWWKILAKKNAPFDLILAGNVLNESRSKIAQEKALESLKQLTSPALWPLESGRGAGVLFVEPAQKNVAQFLSLARDHFIEKNFSIWGPCLHTQACPLSMGKDWCHFSTQIEISGQWFQWFSKRLGSIREWVKYSYLWVAPPLAQKPKSDPTVRLVISDPIPNKGSAGEILLLCEPQQPRRVSASKKYFSTRGELLKLS